MDLSLGAGLLAVTYLAKSEFKATQYQLGLLALCSAGAYFVASMPLGWLSDKWGHRRSITCAGLTGTVAFFCAPMSTSIGHLYVVSVATAIAMGAFWPALEADIGVNSTPAELPRRIGRFNVAWCAGFAVAGVASGALGQVLGHRPLLIVAGALSMLATLIHCLRVFDPEPHIQARRDDTASQCTPTRAAAFWKIALILNFSAMGLNASLRYHVSTVTGGENSFLGGLYLTTVFTLQLVTFVVLGRWHGWHHRGWPLAAACLMLVGGGALCGLWPHSVPLFGAGCALTGIGCGLIYNSSIYYSVAIESGRGHRGGIHESVLGMGAAVVPYAGGLMAMLPALESHDGWKKGIPFLTGVGFMLLAALAAAAVYPRGSLDEKS